LIVGLDHPVVAADGADRDDVHRSGQTRGTDESFNGQFRDQHLSLQWFRNRADAKASIEQWRRHYKDVRPHSSLGYLTPTAFAAKHLFDLDGGRPPAMPARADHEEHKIEEPITSVTKHPIGAILQ
jgi:hypothetical protein